MKNKSIIFVTLSLILMLICGCNSSVPNEKINYVAYEAGSFDSSDNGKHLSEIPIWSTENMSRAQDPTAAETISVTFNGKSYTANYVSSGVTYPNLYLEHKYYGDNAIIKINADTGELTGFILAQEPTANSTITEEQCKQIADNIAKDYIDLSKYTVKTKKTPLTELYNNYIYAVTYYREISGFATSDRLGITVSGDGTVISFGYSNLGSFDGVDEIQADNEIIQNVISEKISSIYPDTTKHIGYEVDSVILIRLEDGTPAFLYTIENRFGDGSFESGSVIRLLVAQQNSKIPT